MLKLSRLASIGLIAGAALSFSILAGAVYSRIHRSASFAAPLAVSLYYVAPATAVVLLLAALKLPPVPRLRLFLSCVSVAASLTWWNSCSTCRGRPCGSSRP